MEVVQVLTGPKNIQKFLEGVTLRVAVFVRRQVARDDVWTDIVSIPFYVETQGEGWTEIRAARQISGRVGFLWLTKVRVVTRSEIEVRRSTGGVTEVAIRDGIHPITAEADQGRVFPFQI